MLGGIWVAAFVVVIFILNTLHVGYLVSRLRETAVTDPLTGAMNRKGLFERAQALRSVADRGGRPTAVVVLDLDQFKQFNDRYGHAAGDRLLADLVAAWSTVLRPSDLIARIGGDEFVLLLPNCDSDQAEAMLGRLRDVSGSGWTCRCRAVEGGNGHPLGGRCGRPAHVRGQAESVGHARPEWDFVLRRRDLIPGWGS